MSRTRTLASILVAALMVLAPALMVIGPLTAPVAHALESGTSISVFPTKVVKDQDVLFTIQQTAGAFSPGATLYVKVKNEPYWGTDPGYLWIPLPSGSSTIPRGSTLYLPASYSATDLYGSSNLATGAAYIHLSDSSDGSSGVINAEITVEAGPAPVVYINGYRTAPSDVLSISYDSTGLATYTVQTTTEVATASPGDVVTVSYSNVEGNRVTIYWDYYGGLVLGSGPGGSGTVQVTIPDAPEGFHAIIVASDEGYEAFNWVYVEPKLIPSTLSISGAVGETITFTGKGFPAGATISSIKLVGESGTEYTTSIVSGGTVDSSGRVTIQVRLEQAIIEYGILDVKVYYDSGDVDLKLGGTFQQGQIAPAGDTIDEIQQVLAVSTPIGYGDEMVKAYLPASLSAGSLFKVAVVNFPAHAKVDIYVGHVLAGSLVTDARGAAIGYVQVPTLPGVDNDGNTIPYKVTAKARDPQTGGTLIAEADSSIKIPVSVSVSFEPSAYNGDYLMPGFHTVKIDVTGAPPYATIIVYESLQPGPVAIGFADAQGTAHLAYVVNPDYYYDYDTGTSVDVNVYVKSATGALIELETKTYRLIGPASLEAYGADVIGAASSIDYVEWLDSETPVVHPGDYIKVIFTGAVPDVYYYITWNGSRISMYKPDNTQAGCVQAKSDGTVTVRFYVPDSASAIGLNVVALHYCYGPLANSVAGEFNIVVSSPRTDLYGPARVVVSPSAASPGDPIEVFGVNFVPGETVTFGISSISTPLGTGIVNDHGAVLVTATLPDLPAGEYVVYVERSVKTQLAYNTTIEIVPGVVGVTSLLGTYNYGDASPGTSITVNLAGLDAQRFYAVYWSESEADLGTPLTNVTWLSEYDGTLTVTFTVPRDAVIGETYYFHIVPADSPSIDNVVLTVEVHIIPPSGYKMVYPPITAPYVLAGEKVTIYMNSDLVSNVLSDLNSDLSSLNITLTREDLLANGTADANITLPSGDEVVVPVDMMGDDSGGLYLSFTVPNVKEAGVISVVFEFSYAVNESGSSILARAETPFGGFKLLQGGGVLLANVEDGIATIIQAVDQVSGQVAILTDTVNDLSATILEIKDGVAVINTKLGQVTADLNVLKDMLSDVNATLVAKGDEIVALLNTKSGEIMASLDALTELVNGGFAQVNEGLVTIQTTLGEISMNISDLADFVAAAADAITLTVTDTADSIVSELGAQIQDSADMLAMLIMEKGDEVIANLTMQIEDLKPLIVSVNDTVMRLETILGEVNASVYELLGGQAEIKDLIVNKTGDVVNAIAVLDTRIGEVNATLLAALDMLKTGLVNAHRDIIDRLATLRTTLVTYNSQLADKIDETMQAISGVSSAVNAVSGKIDTLQQAVAGVADTVSSLSNNVNALSGKVDSVATTVSDISGKVVQIQSDVADVKTTASDIKNTVGTLPGKIDDVKSSVDNVGGKVDQVSSKLDSVSSQVSTVQSRATVLNGITIVLVVITLILAAMGLRRPE